MSNDKSSSAIDQTISYGFQSSLNSPSSGRAHLKLATSIYEARYPYFFEGKVIQARSVAMMLLTLSQIVGTRFYIPPNMLKRLIAERDPVITSGDGALRFEGFSACASTYCRVDILPQAYEGDVVEKGTTNVDFNPALKAALASTTNADSLALSVGKEEFAVSKASNQLIEKKVKLPLRWLKGFVEVQAYQSNMEKRLEIGKTETINFLRGLPSNAHIQSNFFVVPAGRGLRLSQIRVSSGADAPLSLSGLKRLQMLKPLLPLIANSPKAALRVFASPDGQTSEWKLYIDDGLIFTLTLSAQPARGFSGEGQVLGDLTDIDEDNLTRVRAALKWQQCLSREQLSSQLGSTTDDIDKALATLGSRGLVGYDLDQQSYFHRELPFDLSLVERMHPRLQSAHTLYASGGVKKIFEDETFAKFEVRGSDVAHIVTTYTVDKTFHCTCQWFSKYQGARGFCKHILATKLDLAAQQNNEDGESELA